MRMNYKVMILVAFGLLLLICSPVLLKSTKKESSSERKTGHHETVESRDNEPPAAARAVAILSAVKPKTRISKPISITSNQGGRPCIEIDHGLRKIDLTGGGTVPRRNDQHPAERV